MKAVSQIGIINILDKTVCQEGEGGREVGVWLSGISSQGTGINTYKEIKDKIVSRNSLNMDIKMNRFEILEPKQFRTLISNG